MQQMFSIGKIRGAGQARLPPTGHAVWGGAGFGFAPASKTVANIGPMLAASVD